MASASICAPGAPSPVNRSSAVTRARTRIGVIRTSHALATIRGASFGGETRALPLIKENERKVVLEAGQHTVHVDFFIQDIVPASAVRTVHANELIPRVRDGFGVGFDIERHAF